MRRDVRILLVGDGMFRVHSTSDDESKSSTEGVGKSTIVTSLIKETFVPNVSVHAVHLLSYT
jgi:hypothetical protein